MLRTSAASHSSRAQSSRPDAPHDRYAAQEHHAGYQPELAKAFYHYLYELAENELSGHQIVIVGQLLVEPEGQGSLAFLERLMPHDDPDYPPLISYYHGP